MNDPTPEHVKASLAVRDAAHDAIQAARAFNATMAVVLGAVKEAHAAGVSHKDVLHDLEGCGAEIIERVRPHIRRVYGLARL